MVASILKAKYFPNSSFLERSFCPNAFYVWRSICAANEVIIRGSQSQIGTGALVGVWCDRWLPFPSTFLISSPRPDNYSITMVHDLITSEANWNVPLLISLFSPEEVISIRSIPLNRRCKVDRLIWHYDKMVVSRWKLCIILLVYAFGPYPKLHVLQHWVTRSLFYGTCWRPKFPQRFEFAWRVFSTIIPNLCHKRIPIDPLCIMCGAASESTTHIILDCHFAWCVWTFSPLGLRPCGVQLGIIKNWAMSMALDLKHGDFDCLLMVVWVIWTARNEKFWSSVINLSPYGIV